jgi:hypothetical protein
MDRSSIGTSFNVIQNGKYQFNEASQFIKQLDQLKPGMTIQVRKDGKDGVVMYLAQKKLKNIDNLISAAGRPKTDPSALAIVLKKLKRIESVKGMDMSHAATFFQSTYEVHNTKKEAAQKRTLDYQQRLAGNPKPAEQTQTIKPNPNDRRQAIEFDSGELKASLAMEELELAAKDKRAAAAHPETTGTVKPAPGKAGIDPSAFPSNPFMEDTPQFQFDTFAIDIDSATATTTTTSSSTTSTSSASQDNPGSTTSKEIPKEK